MPRIAPFERYPKRYDRWFNNNFHAYESELFAIQKKIPKGKFGIEIGVGSGRFAAPLGIKLGVEPSAKMRMLSKEKDIDLIDSIAETLPFRDSMFEFVLMVTTICFIDDIDLSFKEAFRILRKEGKFIIGFIDRKSPIGKKYEKYKENNVFYEIADFYSVEEVISHLKKAKFKNLTFNQTIFNDLSNIIKPEPVKEGCGEGSFVVIQAIK